MFAYKESLGFWCHIFSKNDQYSNTIEGIMYGEDIILAYNNQSRTLRVDYRAFNGQKMRAIKKFLWEDLYNFLKKNKGKDTTYGDADNDDNPEISIVRFIQ